MVPFVILILFKFVATENLTDLTLVEEYINWLPNGYNQTNAYRTWLPNGYNQTNPYRTWLPNGYNQTNAYHTWLPNRYNQTNAYGTWLPNGYNQTNAYISRTWLLNGYNQTNAYNSKPTSNTQRYNYGFPMNGYENIPTKDSGQYYTSDDTTPNEAKPIPVKKDNININDNPSDNHGFNYPSQNDGIMKGTGQGQDTDIQQDAVIPKDTNNQVMQTPNQDRETNFTNTLLIIIGVIALLPTFILAGFMLRKRICVRQSIDPRRQEEAQYEELNYRSVINIANRLPYPLPMQQEQIYTHYNTPYDHRIIPPPARSQVITTHH